MSLCLDHAVQVFGKAFAQGKSRTWPMTFLPHGRLWLLTDKPGKREPRLSEAIACGLTPSETLEELKTIQVPRLALCYVQESPKRDKATEAEFRAGGWKVFRNEPFFVRDLHEPIAPVEGHKILRVTDADLAERTAKAQRARPLTHLTTDDAPVRMYVCLKGKNVVGWVISVRSDDESTWVSNLHVREEFRRQGIGRALMSAMMEDDVRFGLRWSVLLSSQAGANLYPLVGYQQIGLLQIYMPIKASRQVSE